MQQPISNHCLVNLDERKRFSYKSLASLPPPLPPSLCDPSCHFNGISLCKPTAKKHISDSAEGCRLNISLLCAADYFTIRKKKQQTSGPLIDYTCAPNRTQLWQHSDQQLFGTFPSHLFVVCEFCADERPLRVGSKSRQSSCVTMCYERSLACHQKQMCLDCVFVCCDGVACVFCETFPVSESLLDVRASPALVWEEEKIMSYASCPGGWRG